MNSFKSIVFYFPHHCIGGVSVLFLRLAEYLSSTHAIFVADYSDGYMARNLPYGVGLIRIDKGDPFPSDSVFVFQSFLPWRFPYLSKVDMNSRVLFWNLHPKNFDPSIFNENIDNKVFSSIARIINGLAVFRRKKIRNFANYLLERDALAVMDRENARTTGEIIGRNLESLEFLAVPTSRMRLIKKHCANVGVINCAWVGRIADFKYRILEHLIVRLSKASSLVGPLRLIVIGDGEYASYIREVASSRQCRDFQVEFVGELSTSVLPNYLVDNVDLIFSMGTSALEGASLRIPVFLTDYSFNKITKNYRFSLLFENSGYCLGEEIAYRHFEKESSLENSLREVMLDYDKYSARCYEYWENNFSMEKVAPKFLTRCSETSATFGEMNREGYFSPDWLGLLLRSVAWTLRGRYSQNPTGFRHDC